MTKKILLIDDDEDELLIFSEALALVQTSCECIYAPSAEQGINMLKNFYPDYILVDINMPRINGFECLQEIRKMSPLTDTPVILYSTAVNEDIIYKAKALGATSCIKKTYSVEVLAKILKNLLLVEA